MTPTPTPTATPQSSLPTKQSGKQNSRREQHAIRQKREITSTTTAGPKRSIRCLGSVHHSVRKFKDRLGTHLETQKNSQHFRTECYVAPDRCIICMMRLPCNTEDKTPTSWGEFQRRFSARRGGEHEKTTNNMVSSGRLPGVSRQHVSRVARRFPTLPDVASTHL